MQHIKSQLQYIEGSSSILDKLKNSHKFTGIISNLRSIFKENIRSVIVQTIRKSKSRLTNAELIIDTSNQTFKFKEQLVLILSKLSTDQQID